MSTRRPVRALRQAASAVFSFALVCPMLAFALEGNGKGNGRDQDPCTHARGGRCPQQQRQNQQNQQNQQNHQSQQQQQQQQQREIESTCVQLALSLGWKEATAGYVCAGAQNPAAPVLCVSYAFAPEVAPNLGEGAWPAVGLLCRGAVSPIAPIECAKRARAANWSWPRTIGACSSASSGNSR